MDDMLRANHDTSSYEAEEAAAAARRHASLQAKIAQFNELQQRRRQLMLSHGDDEKDDVRAASLIEVIESRDRVVSDTNEILPPGVFSPPSRKIRRDDRRRSTLSTISSDADDDGAMHRYSEYEPGPGVYTEPPSRQNEHIMMHPNLRSSFETLYDSGMELGPPGFSSLERRGRSGSLLSGLRSLESLQGDWEAEELAARRWREDDEASTSTASAASFVRLPAQIRHPQSDSSPKKEEEEEEGMKTPTPVNDETIEETVVKSQESSVPQKDPNDDRPIFPGEAPKRPKPRATPNSNRESERKKYAQSVPQPPKRRSLQLEEFPFMEQDSLIEDIVKPENVGRNVENRKSNDSLEDDLEALQRSINDDVYRQSPISTDILNGRPKSPATTPLKEPLASESSSPLPASSSSSAFPFQQETKSSVPLTRGMRMSDRQAISKRPSLSEMRQRFESLSQSSDTSGNVPNQQKTDLLRRPFQRRSSQEPRTSLSSTDGAHQGFGTPQKDISKPRESGGSLSSQDFDPTANSAAQKGHSRGLESSVSSNDPNSLESSSLADHESNKPTGTRESRGLQRYEEKIRKQGVAAFVQLAPEGDPKLTQLHAWSNTHPTQEYIVNSAKNETDINMSVLLRQSEDSTKPEMHRTSFQMITTEDRPDVESSNIMSDEDNEGILEDQILPTRLEDDKHFPPERDSGNQPNGDFPTSKSRIPRFDARRSLPSQEDILKQSSPQEPQQSAQDEVSLLSGNINNSGVDLPPGRQPSKIPRPMNGGPPPLPERQRSLVKETIPSQDLEFPDSYGLSRIPTKQQAHPGSSRKLHHRPARADEDSDSSANEFYGVPRSRPKHSQNAPIGSGNQDSKRRYKKEPQEGFLQFGDSRRGSGYLDPSLMENSDEERNEPLNPHRHLLPGEIQRPGQGNQLIEPSSIRSQENSAPVPVQRMSMKQQRDAFFGLTDEMPISTDEDNLRPQRAGKLIKSETYPHSGYDKDVFQPDIEDTKEDKPSTNDQSDVFRKNPPPYTEAARRRQQLGLSNESPPELPTRSPPAYVGPANSSERRGQLSSDSYDPHNQSSDYDTLHTTWSRPHDPMIFDSPSIKEKTSEKSKAPSKDEDRQEITSELIEDFIDHVYRSKGSLDRLQKFPHPTQKTSQFNEGISGDSDGQHGPERPPHSTRRCGSKRTSRREPHHGVIPPRRTQSPPPEAFGDSFRHRRSDNMPVSQSDPHAPRREPGPPPRSYFGIDPKQEIRSIDNRSPTPPLPQRMRNPADVDRNPKSKVNRGHSYHDDPSYFDSSYKPAKENTKQRAQQSGEPFLHPRYQRQYPHRSDDSSKYFQSEPDYHSNLRDDTGLNRWHPDSRNNQRDCPGINSDRYPGMSAPNQLTHGRNQPYRGDLTKSDLPDRQFPEQYDRQPISPHDSHKYLKPSSVQSTHPNFHGTNPYDEQYPNQLKRPIGKSWAPSQVQSRNRFLDSDESGRDGDTLGHHPFNDEIFPGRMIPQQNSVMPRQSRDRSRDRSGDRLSGRRLPSSDRNKSRLHDMPNYTDENSDDLHFKILPAVWGQPPQPTSNGQLPFSQDFIKPSHERQTNAARPHHEIGPSLSDLKRQSSQPYLGSSYPQQGDIGQPNERSSRNQLQPQFGHYEPHLGIPKHRSNQRELSKSFDPLPSAESNVIKPGSFDQPVRSSDPRNAAHLGHYFPNERRTVEPYSNEQLNGVPFVRQHPVRKRELSNSRRKKSSDNSNRSEPLSMDQGFEFDPMSCQFIPKREAGQLQAYPLEQSSQSATRSGKETNLVFDPITGQFIPQDYEQSDAQNARLHNKQQPKELDHSSHPQSDNYQNSIPYHRQTENFQQPPFNRQRDFALSGPPTRSGGSSEHGHSNREGEPVELNRLNKNSQQRPPQRDKSRKGQPYQHEDISRSAPYNWDQPSQRDKFPPQNAYPIEQYDNLPQSSSTTHEPGNFAPHSAPQKLNQFSRQSDPLQPGVFSTYYPNQGGEIPSRKSSCVVNQPYELIDKRQNQQNDSSQPDRLKNHPSAVKYPGIHPHKGSADPRTQSYPYRPPNVQQQIQHPMKGVTDDLYPQNKRSRDHRMSPQYSNKSNSNQQDQRSQSGRSNEQSPLVRLPRPSSPSKPEHISHRHNQSTSSRPPLPSSDDSNQFIDHKYLSLGRLPPHCQIVPEGPQYLSDIIVPYNTHRDQNEPPAHPGAPYQLRSNPTARPQLVHSSKRGREGSTAQRATMPTNPDGVRRVHRAASDVRAPPLPPRIGGKVGRSASSVGPSKRDDDRSEDAEKLERLRATFEEADRRLGDLGNREEDSEERREHFWRQMASLQRSDFTWDDTDEWVTDAAKESPWALLKDPGDFDDPVAELERMYLDLDLDREDLMERAERRTVPDSLYDRFAQLRAELPPPGETNEAPPVLNHRLPSDSDDVIATPSNCSTLQSNTTSSRSVPHIPHRAPFPHKIRDDRAYRRLHPNVTAPMIPRKEQSSLRGSSYTTTPLGGTTPAANRSRRESGSGQHSSPRSTLSRSQSLGRKSDVLAQPSPTTADYLLPRSSDSLDQRKQWPPLYADEPDPKLDDMAYRRLVRSSSSLKTSNHKPLLGKERQTPFTGDKQNWWPYARVHELKKLQKEKESREEKLHQDVEDEII